MICPKCQSQHAEPIVSWTSSGRKMTVPQLSLWACLNRDCQHHWPREIKSPSEALHSLPRPDLWSPEVPSEPLMG
jgi:hypothetical protein